MNDAFDTLRDALRGAPTPDDAAKTRALAQAMDNFDRLQESSQQMRPRNDRREPAGFIPGVRKMFDSFTRRPWLAAGTSAAALALGMVVFLPVADMARLRGAAPQPDPAVEGSGAPATLSVDSEDDAALRDLAQEQAAPQMPAPSNATGATAAPATTDALQESQPQAKARAAGDTSTSVPASDAFAQAAPIDMVQPLAPNSETFANATPNPVKMTADEPVSTFSIDVDTASYGFVRSSLNAGQLPPPSAVRIEEMINYFPYDYPAPEAGQAFRPVITVMPTPWNAGTQLVHIGIQGELPPLADRPDLNLVFLIDTSGSMDEPNKLPLLKQSFALMLDGLRPTDQVAIVAYAGAAGEVLAPTAANDRAAILAALDRLAAGGSTAGAQGIALAYQVAEGMKSDGEVSRVVLATDGDFNVGLADPQALTTYIATQRESGTYLSVLGFGRGNLDDATMQALAQNGNGTASYIDTLGEARKVLVDQLTGALYPIANNVKIQVEWNPAKVAEYRLIGYETRALAREDFNNDKVDAGDIGAGSAVTAIYEITAPGSPALLNDPLRYQATDADLGSEELGFLRIRHVEPGQTDSILQATAILPQSGAASPEARFAAAIAGFGQLLGDARYLGEWNWDQAISMALEARGADPFGYRIEAVNLMRLAKALSHR